MKNTSLILKGYKGIKLFCLTLILLCSLTSQIYSQYQTPIVSQGPLKLGQSVVTSFDPSNDGYNVVRVVDLRNRPPFQTNGHYWNSPAPNQFVGSDWTKARMGNVFGITLDDANPPNIYISRSTVFCSTLDTLEGLIYKIDGTTWAVSNYVIKNIIPGPPMMNVNWMPNTGPGLGNLCYDKWHNQIFTTNFEDGKIYRIKGSIVGNVQSVFDPFVLDPGTSPGFVPRGERMWGIGVYGNSSSDVRVYFSRWVSDRSNITGPNEIRSIALDNNGEFITGSERIEITLPLITGSTFSSPVSDIEFSNNGTMLLGERSMSSDMGSCTNNPNWAHVGRILEYLRNNISGLYYNPPVIHIVGLANYKQSSGGVDFDFGISDSLNNENSLCDSIIVGTGDYLYSSAPPPPPLSTVVYGLQITERSSGGSPNADFSQYVDLNGDLGSEDKTMSGDIDVYRKDLCSDTNCISLVSDTTYCDSSGTYYYEFRVHNNSPTKTVEQLEITVDSPKPPNYVVTVPSTINVTIGPSGTSDVQRVRMIGPGAIARTEVCYTLSAQYVNDDCPWCCYIENCIKLPDCGSCVQVLSDSLYCLNNEYFYKFTLQNGTIYDVTKIQITSPGADPITFVPQIIHFNTPIAPGQVFPNENVQVLGGVPGMTIPIRIKLFSDDFECCYIELNHTFPYCDSSSVGIQGNELNVNSYNLGQNYPNPFNPTTYISFAVPEESVVELNIFDVSGRLVQNLVNNVKYAQGVYSVKFDGSNLPSGMYYYRLKTKDFISTRKMVLMK